MAEEKKVSSIDKNILWGIIISVLAVLFVIIAANSRIDTFNINDYISVAYDGVNGEGTAEATFDTEAFENDLGSRIKLKGSESSLAKSGADLSDAALLAENFIAGELSPSEGLSNGDEITWTWNVDEDGAKSFFKAVPEYEDITFTVEGLEEKDTTGMVFPDSDSSRLKASDLEGMDVDELKMALYEIYARHGYIFHNEDTQKAFEKLSWYEPTIDADDWDGEKELSRIELANEKLLKEAIKAAKESE